MAYIPVQGLFETHLTVSNLQRSIKFYQDIVGLQLALEVSDRNTAFFWIGDSKHSMFGLLSFGSTPMGLNPHIAFEVAIDYYWKHQIDSIQMGLHCCHSLE